MLRSDLRGPSRLEISCRAFKTTRFTAFFGPRGRGSASVFSSFLHARSLNKCSKPCVFARFSRFLGLATDLWFFASVLTRFYSLFAKHCKNNAFSRLFLNVDANLVGVSGLPSLIFVFSRANLWVQTAFGSLRGAAVSQNLSRTTRLCAFFVYYCGYCAFSTLAMQCVSCICTHFSLGQVTLDA